MARKVDRNRFTKGQRPRWKTAIKWLVIGGVWFVILFGLMIAWYASDLPQLIKSTHFDKRPSIIFKAMDGTVVDRSGDTRGEDIDAKTLPPEVTEAVLATEDRRFFQHHGIDPWGMMRALGTDLIHRHVIQGGSTITQQLAKNLFLSQERTFRRKVQEALLALYLEHQLTKDEILSAYLNRVYFGDGAYGIDAAAHIYFGKSAHELNLREAAIIAGMLKAPARYSPQSNPGLAAQRAKVVLNAMVEAGYITKARATAESLTVPVPQHKPTEGGGIHYFTDWTAGLVAGLIGETDKDIVVQTTLDPAIQKDAENALSSVLRAKGADDHVTQGAIVVMDRSGAIRAMVGGRDYDQSQFNRATQALRPPGSSFKPFVYLTALQKGWSPNDLIDGSPITTGKYRPANFEHEYTGMVPLSQALAMSLNTAAVRLAEQVGIRNVIQTARRMGIRADLMPELSTALGSNGVPMVEMVSAYGVFANHGRSVNPFAVAGIKDPKGGVLYERDGDADGMGLFDSGVIAQMDDMLQNDVQSGTGRAAALPGHKAAGKTGTSEDFRDAWFIGYSGHYVTAVWVGNDDNSPMKHVTGGMLPAEIWHDVMLQAEDKAGPAEDDAEEKSEPANAPPQNLTRDGTDEEKPAAKGDGLLGVISRIFSSNP